MLVQQILASKDNRSIITVAAETSVSDAAKKLSEHRIGGLIVSPDGVKVIGILSERDIVRAITARGTGVMDEEVGALMTKDPVTCSTTDNSDAIMKKMTAGRFRHMPVVDNGALVGMVTIGDAVKACIEQLSMEKTALEGMIMGF